MGRVLGSVTASTPINCGRVGACFLAISPELIPTWESRFTDRLGAVQLDAHAPPSEHLHLGRCEAHWWGK